MNWVEVAVIGWLSVTAPIVGGVIGYHHPTYFVTWRKR